MVKETATRRRPTGQELYVASMDQQDLETRRAAVGKRVVHAKNIPFEQDQQGIRRTDCHPDLTENAIDFFHVFTHKINTHSGRHIHQGGLTIFVVQGKGYSMVDGKRYNWEAGDLIQLPIKKGGVDHQHFNLDGKPSIWLAIIPHTLQRFVGRKLTQTEFSPTWKH